MKKILIILPITLALIILRLAAFIRPIKRMMVAYLRMLHKTSEILERGISKEFGEPSLLGVDMEYELVKVEHLHNKIKFLQHMFGIKVGDYDINRD